MRTLEKNKFCNKKLKKFVLTGITILFMYQIAMWGIWFICNLAFIPGYGDSPEYVKLASELSVDEYRGILYPIIVKISENIQRVINIPYQSILYIIQNFCSFASFYILISAIIDKMQISLLKISGRTINLKLIITAFIVTLPIIAHFNCTVLVDSLALSSLAVFCGAIIHVSNSEKIDRWVIISIISFIITSLLRTERLYLCIGIVGGTMIIYKICKIKSSYKIFLLVVIIAVSTVMFINHNTQTADYGRAPLTVEGSLFTRIAWPRLEKVYPYLDQDMKGLFTIEQAKVFDEKSTNILYVFLPEVTKGDNTLLPKIYDSVIPVCMKYYGTEIISSMARDFANYLFAPYSIVLDYHSIIIGNTNRTYKMMSENTPLLSTLYFFPTFYGIPFLLTFMIGYMLLGVKKAKNHFNDIFYVTPIILASLGVSLGFVMSAIVGFPNIRFGMIVYVSWVIVGAIFFIRIVENFVQREEELCKK